jgi:serine/threonine-protein kinase
MGVVLLARDPVLGRSVAIKHLRQDLKLDEEERLLLGRRMSQEARAIARVTHPGIVALHDIGEDPSRGTFLVFEYAEGPILQSVLLRGRLTREGTARLAREMGEALSAAHAESVVHRDVKPGNVILTEKGSRIADFGVARLPDSTLTRAGARVGTPAYSAPETVRDGEHSAKSDQFSMAACLYEGLSGKRAFPGAEAVKVASAIEKNTPLLVATSLGLSARVDEVLLRGMAKNPDDRFESCKEFGLTLSEALLGVRELLPTLPDEQILIRYDTELRSRRIGTAILWLLIGATLSAAALRFSAESPPPPALDTPKSERIIRPAHLSPVGQEDP